MSVLFGACTFYLVTNSMKPYVWFSKFCNTSVFFLHEFWIRGDIHCRFREQNGSANWLPWLPHEDSVADGPWRALLSWERCHERGTIKKSKCLTWTERVTFRTPFGFATNRWATRESWRPRPYTQFSFVGQHRTWNGKDKVISRQPRELTIQKR